MTDEPKKAYERTGSHLAEMRSAHDMDSLARAWADFLTYYRRTWFKCLAAYRGERWWSPLEQRYGRSWQDDPVARYILHARNADEHGIRPVAKVRPGFTTLFRGVIKGPAKIEGGKPFTLGPGSAAEFKINPTTVVATSVVDRGQTYDPPVVDGERFPPVLQIAEAGMKFYEALFEEISLVSGR